MTSRLAWLVVGIPLWISGRALPRKSWEAFVRWVPNYIGEHGYPYEGVGELMELFPE